MRVKHVNDSIRMYVAVLVRRLHLTRLPATTSANSSPSRAGLEKIMIFNKKSKKSDFFDLNQIF